MPFALTAVPAALVEQGQDVLIGDIRVLAGTRFAFIDGLTQGVFGDAPANTLFGNLFTETGPMRPFGMDRFIGSGLQYTTDLANGPFPEVVVESAQSFPTSSTTMVVSLPTPLLRDRYIVGTQHNGVNTVTTPTGWTLKSSSGLTDSRISVYERIVDQTFIDNHDYSVTFAATVAGATLAKVWMVRYAHISLTLEIALNTSTLITDTTNDVGALTPSWGNANTLWLTFIGMEADDPSPPNVTAFPTGFTSTGELQNASATASLDGAIAWGQMPLRTTSVDPSAYTYAASRSAAFIFAIPPRVTGAISVVPGGGTSGWDDVLLVDAHSGASNPIVDALQHIEFGAGVMPASGQLRTDSPWEARGSKNMDVTAGEDINLIAFDSSQFRVTAGALSLRASDTVSIVSDTSAITATASTSMTLTSGTNMTFTPSGHLFIGSITLTDDIAVNTVGVIDINSGTDVINLSGNTGINATTITGSITLTSPFVFLPTGFLKFTEVAASTPSMSAGQGLFWVKNDTPNNPFFTDDTNSDRQIATFPIPLSGFATIATDTFLGNVSGSTATPTAVNLSTLAGAGIVFGTHTLDVTAGAGGSIVVGANDVQRGALTGAVTASQDSNTTAFGVLAAKSVLANATNASAVPAALAGSAAFQHLRVNSGNTGLEWSVFTSGDFPAGVIPITAFATIATDTFLANVTAGTASPTAVNISTLAGAGLVFGTHTLDVTAGAGGSLIVSANDIQRAALTGVITAAQDSNTTAFATIANDTFLANVSGGVAAPSATNISTLAGAGLVFGTHTLDVTAGAGASIVVGANDVQRGALTGAITASQDSNTTAFGTLAAKSVLANATNATAVPAALAGSAAFQHLRVNSGNTGLEWSVFTTGDFPAASVPITALATITTDTFLANVTAGTATPTAVNLSTLAGAGLVFGTHTLDVTAGAGASIVVSANDVQRGAITGSVSAAQDVNATKFAGIKLGGSAQTARTFMDFSSLASITVIITDVPGSDEMLIQFQREALTGAVTAAANSNTTAFGVLAAKSVLANATNASAVPAALAGSAAFQHLRVNSANTGLEWSVFTSGDFPAGVVPLTGLATQAAHTFVANATAGVASPTAVTATAATAELDLFTSTLKGLTPLSGGGTTNFLRADGTWAAPVAAGDGLGPDGDKGDITVGGTGTTLTIDAATITSAKMANMAAKSVKGNATNASTVPTDIAGSAAFQHLRVNSGNTGLEWSVFTSGDFPAAVVPITALATQAANTIVANATGATATPTAVTVGAESVFGQTSGNLTGIASAVQTALIRAAGSVFWASAAADQVLRRSGSGDLGFGTLVTNNIGSNQVTLGLLAQVATAKLLGRTTAATGNVEALTLVNSTTITWNVGTGGSISVERAALTGDVTAAANSNATTIATGVVSNTKLATAATLTIKGNITGGTASPTDNTFSATLDAVAGVSERLFIVRDASGWGAHAQIESLAFINLPGESGTGGCVPWIDEDFTYLVLVTLGTAALVDAFVGITNGAPSAWKAGPASAGTCTISALATVNGHNGVIQLQTGATSGNDAVLFVISTIRFDQTIFADFWVRCPLATTETFRVGIMQDETAASGGTDSVLFQFDPAVSSNYQTISRAASGAAVTTTTSVAGNTLYHRFIIWRENAASVRFYIDDVLVATHTTQIPSTVRLFALSYIKTNTAALRQMQVDRIRLFMKDSTMLT